MALIRDILKFEIAFSGKKVSVKAVALNNQ